MTVSVRPPLVIAGSADGSVTMKPDPVPSISSGGKAARSHFQAVVAVTSAPVRTLAENNCAPSRIPRRADSARSGSANRWGMGEMAAIRAARCRPPRSDSPHVPAGPPTQRAAFVHELPGPASTSVCSRAAPARAVRAAGGPQWRGRWIGDCRHQCPNMVVTWM